MEVVVEREDGTVVCEQCALADRAVPRMRGLLGRSELRRGEGILLQPASSIHMWFMRFPIDAVFLDRDLRVLRVVRGLQPWRIASRRGAHAVLELAEGECDRRGVAEGQRLRIRGRT
jgi:uncharacterized membrane protein (UPF0127 family)